MAHKSQDELAQDLEKATKQVVVGGTYVHFKSPTMRYRIIDLAINTDDSSVCVVYRALYGRQILFIRSIDQWLDEVDSEGRKVKRFTLVKG